MRKKVFVKDRKDKDDPHSGRGRPPLVPLVTDSRRVAKPINHTYAHTCTWKRHAHTQK